MKTSTRKSDGTRFSLVIGDLIDQWLAHPDQPPSLAHRMNPFLRHECYPQEYIDLINSALVKQSEIGWINMFRGYFSKQWYQLASSHFGPDDDPNTIIHRNDGANRVYRSDENNLYIDNRHLVGSQRGSPRVERDKETRRLSAIDSEITKLHSEADSVLNDDRFYCEISLNRLLKGSLANKRRWLMRVKASRKRKALFLNQQPRITKFFPSAGSPAMPTELSIEQSGSKRNQSTQHLLTQSLCERVPNRPITARNKTTQQLITGFLKERASNNTDTIITPSPSPSTKEVG
jgi:hypothetical protein